MESACVRSARDGASLGERIGGGGGLAQLFLPSPTPLPCLSS